jgi:prevent-host-death family protein
MGQMRKATFTQAKAHLSEYVDAAEHNGVRVLILRHGKPAAAIVPVSVADPRRSQKRPRSAEEIESLYAALGPGDGESAVDDLLTGRR